MFKGYREEIFSHRNRDEKRRENYYHPRKKDNSDTWINIPYRNNMRMEMETGNRLFGHAPPYFHPYCWITSYITQVVTLLIGFFERINKWILLGLNDISLKRYFFMINLIDLFFLSILKFVFSKLLIFLLKLNNTLFLKIYKFFIHP